MERGEIAPKEQFLLFSTIFCYLLLEFHVETGTRFRNKRLFKISKVQIMRIDCILIMSMVFTSAADKMKPSGLPSG